MKTLEDNVEKSLLRQEEELEDDVLSGDDLTSVSRAMKEMKAKHEVCGFVEVIELWRTQFLIDGHGATPETTDRPGDEER